MLWIQQSTQEARWSQTKRALQSFSFFSMLETHLTMETLSASSWPKNAVIEMSLTSPVLLDNNVNYCSNSSLLSFLKRAVGVDRKSDVFALFYLITFLEFSFRVWTFFSHIKELSRWWRSRWLRLRARDRGAWVRGDLLRRKRQELNLSYFPSRRT